MIEAVLCNFSVVSEHLLSITEPSTLCVPVLWIIFCDFAHPVLFGHSSPGVAVIVNHLNIIDHPNNHKLWEAWDLRRSNVEILQRVSDWKKVIDNLKSHVSFHFVYTQYTVHFNKQYKAENKPNNIF